RTACEDADVECGAVANQFQRAAHKATRVLSKYLLSLRVAMMDDLIRIGGAAIHHCAIAVGLEHLSWYVLCRAERAEEFVFVPRPEQDVITPFSIRVIDSVFGELWSLLDSGGAGHVAEP